MDLTVARFSWLTWFAAFCLFCSAMNIVLSGGSIR